jgi:hypothetical protein
LYENLDISVNAKYIGKAEHNVFLADYLSRVDQAAKIVNIGVVEIGTLKKH